MRDEPRTLLRLANLTVQRRPDRGPAFLPDPLASAAEAAQALGLARVSASELRALHELHQTVVWLVDALLGGRGLTRPAAQLTKLAQTNSATVRVDVSEHRTFRARMEWSEGTPSATLARRIALELAEIDPTRLRRCERQACDLLFYDTTRSGTQRWHAESPCGTRERQRRYREASRSS